jgi:glutamate formiminotransferase
MPDVGPMTPHPTAGAIAVGARPVLVAYNVWLRDDDLDAARAIARDLRGPAVRT